MLQFLIFVFCLVVMFSNTIPSFSEEKNVTEIMVYTKNDTPCQNCRVTLVFTSYLGGMTDPFYTDSSGKAYVETLEKGEAKVFVNKYWEPHKTMVKVPGKATVYLK